MSEDHHSTAAASGLTDVTKLDALRLTERLEALKAEYQDLKQRSTELEEENADLSQQITSLTGSSSWRMTRPVRRVIETLRRRRGAGARGDAALRSANGHQPGAAEASASPKAHWVLDTKLFNAQTYRELAGLGRVSDLAAAEHYVTVGERRGLRPNAHSTRRSMPTSTGRSRIPRSACSFTTRIMAGWREGRRRSNPRRT